MKNWIERYSNYIVGLLVALSLVAVGVIWYANRGGPHKSIVNNSATFSGPTVKPYTQTDPSDIGPTQQAQLDDSTGPNSWAQQSAQKKIEADVAGAFLKSLTASQGNIAKSAEKVAGDYAQDQLAALGNTHPYANWTVGTSVTPAYNGGADVSYTVPFGSKKIMLDIQYATWAQDNYAGKEWRVAGYQILN